MTAWDARAFATTFALALLVFGVACALTGATDEGGIAWAVRAMRTVPAAPACGAIVTLLFMRRAERRGELLALASVGCSPSRAAIFAVAGGAALSVIAATSVVARSDAAAGFFPRPMTSPAIHIEHDGFVDDARGIHISPTGMLSTEPAKDEARAKTADGLQAGTAAIVLVGFGLGLALVTARPLASRRSRLVGLVALACVCCIFLLQAAAAGRVPPLVACIPTLALLIGAALRYREPAW